MSSMFASEQALLTSQSRPGAGVPLFGAPTSALTRIGSHFFRVLLLRRLHLHLLHSSVRCRCGRPFDPFGHNRAACTRTGELGRRAFAVESAGVAVNVMVRDMDIAAPDPRDGRRLEIVVDGLPLFGGTQFAVNTTLVSALHCDGSPTVGARDNGAALVRVRRRKERIYPELVGRRARAWLVVLAGEVVGRWSEETRAFIRLLARARTRNETTLMRRRAEQAWRMRWWVIPCCAVVRASAAFLLGVALHSRCRCSESVV